VHVSGPYGTMTPTARPLPFLDALNPTHMWATLATGSHTSNRALPILQAAIDTARSGPLTMAEITSRAGVAATTVYRYFSDVPSLDGIAHLILLEESLMKQSAWAHPDNDAVWDASSINAALRNWASTLATGHDATQQVRSVAVIRATPGLGSHLRGVVQRAAHHVAGPLRDWQARGFITHDVDAYVQALLLQNLHLAGWFHRMRRESDPSADDPRWRNLITTTTLGLQQTHSRDLLVGEMSLDRHSRQSSLPATKIDIDAELTRVLGCEIDSPTHAHLNVVRCALALSLEHPNSDFTIAELHRRSGTPPKQIYELFSGKEQIRRIVLWAFTSATIAAHIGLLRFIPEADNPRVFLSDMLQRFAEPDGIVNRAHRLQGVSTLWALTDHSEHLSHLTEVTSQAADALAQVQQSGRLSDRAAADSVVDLLTGLTMSRAVLDTVGNRLPNSVWARQLDLTFGNLLSVA